MEFQKGDIVEAFGLRGKVLEIDSKISHPVYVWFISDFDEESYELFTIDGKKEYWHKEPSLKLIERPEKKVKKKLYIGVEKRPIGDVYTTSHAYPEKSVLDHWPNIVEVEIEAEEEEK